MALSETPLDRSPHGDLDAAELMAMLQTLIAARCGLSAIHHLFDEARTMADIRARYAEWQTTQQNAPHH